MTFIFSKSLLYCRYSTLGNVFVIVSTKADSLLYNEEVGSYKKQEVRKTISPVVAMWGCVAQDP